VSCTIARTPVAVAARDRAEDWWSQAACRGTDAPEFFPEDFDPGPRREAALAVARRACAGCPVRADCLEHALAWHEPKGVWGGLTAAERVTFAEHRRSAGVPA
jgi:WhiB family redox-sensing transcriptional regulator